MVAGFKAEVTSTRSEQPKELGLDVGIGFPMGRVGHRLLMAYVRRFNKHAELTTCAFERYAISSIMRSRAASSLAGVS